MLNILRLLLATLIFMPLYSYAGLIDFKSGTNEDLQHDFDIVRLNDLVVLSGQIEKFKEVTGKYPFQGETDLPNYTFLATKDQEKYSKGGPPYSHKRTSASTFVNELVSKLGPETQVPFELQKVPVNKPNFYIYMIRGDAYFLAVHVHNDFPFARKIANYYYKVEVTNNVKAVRKGVWLRDDLLAHQPFVNAINAPLHKPGYAEYLRKKLGGNNAF